MQRWSKQIDLQMGHAFWTDQFHFKPSFLLKIEIQTSEEAVFTIYSAACGLDNNFMAVWLKYKVQQHSNPLEKGRVTLKARQPAASCISRNSYLCVAASSPLSIHSSCACQSVCVLMWVPLCEWFHHLTGEMHPMTAAQAVIFSSAGLRAEEGKNWKKERSVLSQQQRVWVSEWVPRSATEAIPDGMSLTEEALFFCFALNSSQSLLGTWAHPSLSLSHTSLTAEKWSSEKRSGSQLHSNLFLRAIKRWWPHFPFNTTRSVQFLILQHQSRQFAVTHPRVRRCQKIRGTHAQLASLHCWVHTWWVTYLHSINSCSAPAFHRAHRNSRNGEVITLMTMQSDLPLSPTPYFPLSSSSLSVLGEIPGPALLSLCSIPPSDPLFS